MLTRGATGCDSSKADCDDMGFPDQQPHRNDFPVGVQIGASFGNEVLLFRLLLTWAREMPCGVRRFGVHSGLWIRRPGGGRFG